MFPVSITPTEAQEIKELDPEKNFSRAIRTMHEVAELVKDYGGGSLMAGRNRLIFELENKAVVK
jgi:hypothetical protein